MAIYSFYVATPSLVYCIMSNMIKLLLRKKINKNCVNGFNHQRELSSVAPEDKDSEISESLKDDLLVVCNKSGLLNQHRNLLHNKTPYKEPHSWIHLTEKYQRKVFGRFGSESGVSPNICFNSKADKIPNIYEQLAEPETLQSMVSKHNANQKRKVDEINAREEEICIKLGKLNQWKQDLSSRIKKKEADAIAAKEKKDRLIEEVRRHFGYNVDPRDERFKEILEQKEREHKKKQKEEKRKEKEQKLMSKLLKSPVSQDGNKD